MSTGRPTSRAIVLSTLAASLLSARGAGPQRRPRRRADRLAAGRQARRAGPAHHARDLSDVPAQALRRVLAADGTVYVLGGPDAVSPEVAAQVSARLDRAAAR